MKTVLLLISIVYTLMAANAKDAAFALDFYDNYEVALSKAKELNKPLMLVVVQDPCPYCDRLVEKTLEDTKVKKALEGFVSVIVDKHGAFPQELKGTPVPMTYFINPKIEKSTYNNLGYLDAEDFAKMLATVEASQPKKIK